MEIRRTTRSSNIPAETETRHATEQPTIARGVGDASDSFVTATQRDPLSMSNTIVPQPPTAQAASTQLVADDSLQKQLELGLAQANIFQIPKKPKLDFGDVSIPLIRLSTVTGKSVEELKCFLTNTVWIQTTYQSLRILKLIAVLLDDDHCEPSTDSEGSKSMDVERDSLQDVCC